MFARHKRHFKSETVHSGRPLGQRLQGRRVDKHTLSQQRAPLYHIRLRTHVSDKRVDFDALRAHVNASDGAKWSLRRSGEDPRLERSKGMSWV